MVFLISTLILFAIYINLAPYWPEILAKWCEVDAIMGTRYGHASVAHRKNMWIIILYVLMALGGWSHLTFRSFKCRYLMKYPIKQVIMRCILSTITCSCWNMVRRKLVQLYTWRMIFRMCLTLLIIILLSVSF